MTTFHAMARFGFALFLCGCAASEPATPQAPWAPNLEALQSCGEDATIGIRGSRFQAMMGEGCTRLLNSLSMEFDYELTDLTVAAPLRRVDGLVIFRENPITSFRGLDRLESIGGVFAALNLPVRDASGLNNLHLVEGDFRFKDNAQLSSLAGLERLERVGGLTIVRNPMLENLDGLRGLRRIDGDVQIIENSGLSADEVEDFLSRVDVGGRVQLAYGM